VEFLLTPNTGDSDIYVARTMQPSNSVYEKGSHTTGIDKVTYKRGESLELMSIDDIYHIAIYGKT
jgi:hypothetical protein